MSSRSRSGGGSRSPSPPANGGNVAAEEGRSPFPNRNENQNDDVKKNRNDSRYTSQPLKRGNSDSRGASPRSRSPSCGLAENGHGDGRGVDHSPHAAVEPSPVTDARGEPRYASLSGEEENTNTPPRGGERRLSSGERSVASRRSGSRDAKRRRTDSPNGSVGGRRGSPSRLRDSREVETLEISDEDASFILGSGGRTKRKLSRVCGAELNVTEHNGRTVLEIKGTSETRERAKLYVGYVMQQRVGPVNLKYDPSERDDLTCIEVPHECVGYVTGRRGQGLRSIEEEWCTLMFFTDLRSQNAGETEKLAIFGADRRARRGAELKVMSAVEQKMPGYFTRDVEDYVDRADDFGTDTVPIKDDDYSYALGKEGSTRKKLARASGAILEYVGRIAFMAGAKAQRSRVREYLQWLCAQRTSYVHVVTDGRNDCTVVNVPTACVAYVTGTKGNALRRIEDLTGSFIFLDGTRGSETERLLIFGEDSTGRHRAKDLVAERIEDKESGRSRYIGRGGAMMRGPHHFYGGGRSRSRSFSPRRYRDKFRGRSRSFSNRGRSPSRSYSPRYGGGWGGRRRDYRGGGNDRFMRRGRYGGNKGGPRYGGGYGGPYQGDSIMPYGGGGPPMRYRERSYSPRRSRSVDRRRRM